MTYYLETSALVKTLLDEDGAETVAVVVSGPTRLTTCRIAYPEARAAIAAAMRLRRLKVDQAARARDTLDRVVWPEIDVVEVTALLAASAGDLAERHGLRGFDAVHLAAALEVAGDDLVLMTWDRRLWQAAHNEGLAVLPADPPGA